MTCQEAVVPVQVPLGLGRALAGRGLWDPGEAGPPPSCATEQV